MSSSDIATSKTSLAPPLYPTDDQNQMHRFFKTKSRPPSTFSHSQIVPETKVPLRTPIDTPMQSLHLGTSSALPESSMEQSSASASTPCRSRDCGERALSGLSQDELEADACDQDSFNLSPPPPAVGPHKVELLAMRLFSVDHLNMILRHHCLHQQFRAFLIKYMPHLVLQLVKYIDTQKAMLVIEYANALGEKVNGQNHDTTTQPLAAMDPAIHERAHDIVQGLLNEGLPAYVTHRLTRVATDSLVKAITGQGTPLMRDMIPALAEVYCVTDPSMPDNPIVYASKEFYNITQYAADYVIGRNCRFLQGPRTSIATVRRLVDALAAGKESTETILNYRRDGTPFLNLLLIAPLYDNKGDVRYFLGCQIDITSLIEDGRGLESLERLLARDRKIENSVGPASGANELDLLGELGAMLSEDESRSIKSRPYRSLSDAPARPTSSRSGRVVLGAEEDQAGQGLWPDPSLGPSGRLPGVYQNYLLVRPYPSLRITFTSPALQIPGLLQTRFMDRVDGPAHVREGVIDALSSGTSVTARILWLAGSSSEAVGKSRWIHCTPLLGSDERVGVWMVVMVEQEEVTGALNRGDHGRVPSTSGSGGGRGTEASAGASSSHRSSTMVESARHTSSNKLYLDYLRQENRSERSVGRVSGIGSTRSGV